MTLERVRSLHLAAESAFRTDPSADGSGYAALQARAGFPVHDLKTEETNYAIGRNAPTEMQPLVSDGSLEVEWDPTGFAASAGDGASPPAVDVVDAMFTNALGQPLAAVPGEGVGAGSGVGNLILDAAVTALENDYLAPLWSASLGRCIWRYVTDASGEPTYVVAPNWPTAPLTADVLCGARLWGQLNSLQAQGATLAACAGIDGQIVRMLAGRHASFRIEVPAGGKIKAFSSLRFNSWDVDTAAKTALPAITTFPDGPIGVYSPIFFGGSNYAASAVKLDFGLTSAPFDGTEGAAGRTDDQVLAIDPTIEFDPGMALATWHDALNNKTISPVLLQIGPGSTTQRVNSFAFFAPRAQVIAVSEGGKSGYVRHSVKLRVLDSGTNNRVRWLFGRC